MSVATAYVMSDFASVRLPESAGGCGEQHEAVTDGDGYRCVRCDRCAPILTGSHYGYSATRDGVPSTPDEMAHREYLKREAETANAALDVQIRRSFARQFAEEARASSGGPSNPADFVASLSPAEKRELAAMLAKEAGGEEKAEAPVKRGPGRPRKTTA